MARKLKTKKIAKRKTAISHSSTSVKAVPMPKTKTIGQLRGACIIYGDQNQANFLTASDPEEKMTAGKNAMSGYKQAIDAFKTQLFYKKMTGCTKKVPFGEE